MVYEIRKYMNTCACDSENTLLRSIYRWQKIKDARMADNKDLASVRS